MENKGRLAILAIVLICAGSYIWWFTTQKNDSDRTGAEAISISEEDMEGTNYHYQQLNPDEKVGYRFLYQGCLEYEPDIYIKPLSDESSRRVLLAFRYDHPEFYWVKDDATITSNSMDVTDKISFTVPPDAEAKVKKLKNKADSILKEAPLGEYEKVKYIYEYIINNTDYDLKAPDNQTAYSVLINGSSVCGGYASAFLYLCDRAGIDCAYVTGEIIGKGPHAWNLVKISGDYYWVDTTWGDPAYFITLKGQEDIFYDYLCVTDEQIMSGRVLCNDERYSNHESHMDFTYPKCSNWSLNYYSRLGAYIEYYSRVAVYNAIMLQAFDPAKPLIIVKFASEEAFNQAIDDLFNVNDYSSEIINDLEKRYGLDINYGDIMTVGGNIHHLIIKKD